MNPGVWFSSNLFYNIPHTVYRDADGKLRPGTDPTTLAQTGPAKGEKVRKATNAQQLDSRRSLDRVRVGGVERQYRADSAA
jgi:hypothetical protein